MLVFILYFAEVSIQQGREHDVSVYQQFLEQETTQLNGLADQLTSLATMLVKNPIVINALENISKRHAPTTSASLLINKNLENIGTVDNVSAVFLMDLDGNCVFSSKPSFIGKNYGFRPYFIDALHKGVGLYTAMGVTSKKLGIYYSQIVNNGQRPVGVAVLKIKPTFFYLHSFSTLFSGSTPSHDTAVSGIITKDGIVIDTDLNALLSLEQLSVEQITAMKKSRQFSPEEISSFGFPPKTVQSLLDVGFLKQVNREGTEYYLFTNKSSFLDVCLIHIIDAKWFRENFRPVSSLYPIIFTILGGIVLFLLVFLYLFEKQYKAFRATSFSLEKETLLRLTEKEKYQTIINQNPEGFWLQESDTGVIVDVNPSLCQLLGKSSFQIIGHKGSEFLIENMPLMSSEKDETGFFESQVRLAHGQVRDVIVHHSRLVDAEGEIAYSFAFFADITEKNIQQRQLLLFSRAVEQNSSSIVITDTQGGIVYTNPAFTDLTGYGKEEVYGQNPRILQSGKTDPAVYKEMWSTILSGKTWKGYIRNKKKNGELYWEGLSISPIFNNHQKISHFLAIKNDITQRITLEKRVEAQAAELQLILDHAVIGIAQVVDHKFVWVSKAGAQLFGFDDPCEVQGRASIEVFPNPESFYSLGGNIEKIFEGKDVFHVEQLLKKRDGSLFWCSLAGKIIDPADVSQGAIWLVQDISDQKKSEQQLRLARDEAWKMSQAKTDFLANMSHEIRTPMNSIIGMSKLALETALDDEQQYLIKNINLSAEFLLGLINDILDFSKIESGKIELENDIFSLEQLLKDIFHTVGFIAQKKNLALDYSIASSVPEFVNGDSQRLRQILINLLSNGIKFTDKGSISVQVTPVQESEEDITLQIAVQDTGIGIPEEKVDYVFDKFSQLDGGLSRGAEGTGLGLAISKKLCELLGGHITVTSSVGKGSIFTFTVCMQKVNRPEKVQGDSSIGLSTFALPELRILLVDDNEANRYITSAMFRKDAHLIVEAVDGVDALVTLSKQSFDVVLMDVQMPTMDGVTATRIIRALEMGQESTEANGLSTDLLKDLAAKLRGGHIFIIALTAHAFKEDKNRCLKAGMDGYMSKPCQKNEMYRILQRILFSGEDSLQDCLSDEQEEETAAVDYEPTAPTGVVTDAYKAATEHLKTVYALEDEQICNMLQLSATSLADALQRARQAIRDEDLGELSAAAHKAKGTLLGIGLHQEAESAKIIEIGSKEAMDTVQLDAFEGIIQELEDLLRPLLAVCPE